MTGDMITLTIPREEPFHEIAHLVLGGVAARLNLTFERRCARETALEAVPARASDGGEVTVELRLNEQSIVTRVGPFTPDELQAELDRDDRNISLRRILDTVVDGYELDGDGW